MQTQTPRLVSFPLIPVKRYACRMAFKFSCLLFKMSCSLISRVWSGATLAVDALILSLLWLGGVSLQPSAYLADISVDESRFQGHFPLPVRSVAPPIFYGICSFESLVFPNELKHLLRTRHLDLEYSPAPSPPWRLKSLSIKLSGHQ